MADLLVRRLDDKVKSTLKRRALKSGRSVEAEAREILSSACEEAVAGTIPAGESLGELMERRFGKRGLTPSERQLFNSGIIELNSTWDSKIAGLFD